ncbi:hypothetical protein KGM_208345 [Danaus plexippus plexippus]|uniref:Uncharacterized protein n=1 Tax=Danaus plexippus plexippus TaxID=278856 RepID=A0A212EP02_DANPL|nr:hypothetical protein KGM_208345 [Danaus plexippus plexippus]
MTPPTSDPDQPITADLLKEMRELRCEVRKMKQGGQDLGLLRKEVEELRTQLASLVPVISQFAELSKLLKSRDPEISHLKTTVTQFE